MCLAAALLHLAPPLKERERRPRYFFTPAMDDESATPITSTWITTTASRSLVTGRGGALGLARVKEPVECRRSGFARAVGTPYGRPHPPQAESSRVSTIHQRDSSEA